MSLQCGFFCLLLLLSILTTTQVACRHTTRLSPPLPSTSTPRGPVDDPWDSDPGKPVDPWDESDPRGSRSRAYSKAFRLQQVKDRLLAALRMNASDVARANEAVRRHNHSWEFLSTMIQNTVQKGRNTTSTVDRNAGVRTYIEPAIRPREVIVYPAPFPPSLQFPTRQHNIMYFDVSSTISRLTSLSSPKIESSSLNVFVVAASEYEASAPLTLGVYDQTFNPTVPPRTFYDHPDTGCHYCIITTTWTLVQNLITMAKGINVTESGEWIQIPLGRFPQRWIDDPLENRGLAVYNGTYPQYSWVQAVKYVVIPGLHKEPYLHLKLTARADPGR